MKASALLLKSLAVIFLISLFSCNSSNTGNTSQSEVTKAIKSNTGVGKPFGARDPYTCADSKQPTSGLPSAEQAKEYFICQAEYVSGNYLYLVSDVTLETGKPRDYNSNEDLNCPNIDVTVQVLPIHGKYKSYQCALLSDILQNQGKNCYITQSNNAVGLCYKNSFGDWVCKMGDASMVDVALNAAPPQ